MVAGLPKDLGAVLLGIVAFGFHLNPSTDARSTLCASVMRTIVLVVRHSLRVERTTEAVQPPAQYTRGWGALCPPSCVVPSLPALPHSGKGFRAFLVGAGGVKSEEGANMAKKQRPGTMSIHIRQSYGEEASVRVPHWPGRETEPLRQLPRHRGDQQAPQLGGEEGVGGGMR